MRKNQRSQNTTAPGIAAVAPVPALICTRPAPASPRGPLHQGMCLVEPLGASSFCGTLMEPRIVSESLKVPCLNWDEAIPRTAIDDTSPRGLDCVSKQTAPMHANIPKHGACAPCNLFIPGRAASMDSGPHALDRLLHEAPWRRAASWPPGNAPFWRPTAYI